jgi:hypothetical protein
MRVIKFITFVVILVVASTLLVTQDKAAEPTVTVKHVPITSVSPTSGKEMFKSYCAVCHGADAKGGGPAASALKAPPADLTVLAQKNGGKFPAAHVAAAIRGESAMASHGSKDMPVWGPLFSSISQGDKSLVSNESRISWTTFKRCKQSRRLRPPRRVAEIPGARSSPANIRLRIFPATNPVISAGSCQVPRGQGLAPHRPFGQ